MRTGMLLLLCLGLSGVLGESREVVRPGVAARMPAERAQDSYAIYSQLLKTGRTDYGDQKRGPYLINGTTLGISVDWACKPLAQQLDFGRSPHYAVRVPVARLNQWSEILADYDRHCHDVIQLAEQGFTTESPVHLLNEEDRKRFKEHTMSNELASSGGLHIFSEVFFNVDHTLALVQEGTLCDSLCGYWSWVVLERRFGRWKSLPWVSQSALS